MQNKKIGFIGAGNMAYAIMKGCIDSKVIDKENIYASDPDKGRLEKLVSDFSLDYVYDENEIVVEKCDILIVAVKPQMMSKVYEGIKPQLDDNKLVVSIAAGLPCSFFEYDGGPKVVRVMPNTPALVLEGAAAVCKGTKATNDDIEDVLNIFKACGKAVEVDEKLMDAVTGLSGSGPAYVFQILEALSDGGVKCGLTRDVANTLAAQTVFGAAKLFLESGLHQGQLKDMVTSPGGTTIAGLHELEKGGLRATMMNAVEAAVKRSEELGKK